MKKIFVISTLVAGWMVPASAQDDAQAAMDRAMAEARREMEQIQKPEVQEQLNRAMEQIQKPEVQEQIHRAMEQVQGEFQDRIGDRVLDGLNFRLDGLLALGQQDPDRAQEARERAQEARERVQEARERMQEARERIREMDDSYREATELVDEHRYQRAVDRFDRVIENKSTRADGAYYWKAYALNKLGKRDEALAALAEIPKQFPQSRWINDANALKIEIQQETGTPVSPEGQSDDDLKVLAINALMNSDPDRAIPLLEKVLNDPKNDLGLKARALFVLAQSPSDRAHAIVLQYARRGPNPDLQMRAVSYVGGYRSKDSQQALADIYSGTSDVDVRRAVLRGMSISRDSAHLLNVAKTETNADLRRDAIRYLGNMQAATELAQLYPAESNNDLKEAILMALLNSHASGKLLEIAKTEKNPELRGDAIRYLGNMHKENSADALSSLYSSESDKNVKEQIIRALGVQGAGKQLVDVVRKEKDPDLKRDGVQWLGRMRGSKEATDYLMELINK
ncbi:MAG TPA: HEAT repeat domain-containing protein [Bryobacteraceae bacterium]|nr:HEAT repeat domain-containing protein [Bryobacteraceae bacterium]